MTVTSDLLKFLSVGERVDGHKPFQRFRLNRTQWMELISLLSQNNWALMGIWAEPQEVHAAFYEEKSKTIAVASLACADGRFPSLSGVRPSAIRLERTIQDFTGLIAENLTDNRPWLDHGQFPIKHPLRGDDQKAQHRPATEYTFLPILGEGLHQIPVGPVHAGIIEPGHFRFTCNGEAVVRLEERLGYVHKGVERHMQGKTPAEAVKVASRISGDSTVAHALAFSRAVEAALDIDLPAHVHWTRALMAELERIANHFGDIGAICNDAAFAFMLAQCGLLREKVLATAQACFGHRMMMDCIVPGGVTRALNDDGIKLLQALVVALRSEFAPLVKLYEDKLSLQDRTMTTGVVSAALVHRFAAGGFVGRGSARSFDARRVPSYPPYDNMDFEIPVFSEGDVNARVWVRIREIDVSLGIISRLLKEDCDSIAVVVDLPKRSGEGMAVVEGFRGDILTWVRIGADGRVLRCHPRDPSWFQWPLLEASIESNIVADFPLCNKSFNCSYSGQDL